MSIEELALQQSREHLIPFCVTFDRNYTVNWHHREIAHALEKVEKGEIKRLIIEMPPRHGKSLLTSIYFPAWFLGRQPTQEIITASYSGELAKDFGSKTRDVVADAQYTAIFPEVTLKEDSKSKDKWKTNQNGSYTSVGVDGALTGRGANILLIDDPFKNRQEAESDTIRENVWNWYTSTAYTRLEKGGSIIIIMTRWHTDDLVGRLLSMEAKGGEKWTRIRFPAIAENEEKQRHVGDSLWPEKYDNNSLEQIKRTLGPYDWQALYQQNPVASEHQEFKKEWFTYFKDEEIFIGQLDIYVLVDLAISKATKADNTAIITIGKYRDKPDIYILDINAGHLDPGEVIEYLFHLKNKWKHQLVRVGVESVAYQKALHYFIVEEQRKRQSYFDLVELKAVGSKEVRIRGLIPMYKAGVIHHKVEQTELEEEYLLFPQGQHDDRIDAVAYIHQVLNNTSPIAKVFTPTFNYHRR